MRTICRYRFYIRTVQFFRDVLYVEIIVFDLIYRGVIAVKLIHFKTTAFPVVVI